MRYLITLFAILFASYAHSATYYLDVVNGNDATGDGSTSSPWQTFSKAQTVGVSGDVFMLQTGDYGNYTETNIDRTDYITYQAVDGADVHIDYINILNTSQKDTYLKFVGVKILPEESVNTHDPQDPDSTLSTYSMTDNPVDLDMVSYFQIIDSEISGHNHWLTMTLAYVIDGTNILFDGNYAHTSIHAFRFIDSGSNVTVRNNRITDLTGSAINTFGYGYSGMVYEYNYIYETCIYPLTEDYAPKADLADPHGSGVSIRDGGTTVRNNIFRRVGSTSGIMLYQDGVDTDYVNENILIENNLIYDTPAVYPLRMNEIGRNVVVRNNIFIGEEYGSGVYQYRAAVLVEDFDSQNGTPSLEMYNNIIIGMTEFRTGLYQYLTESNNIFWSIDTDDEWLCDGDLSTSKIYACTTESPSDPQAEMEALFPNESSLTFVDQHGLVLDFTVGQTSLAYNFGSATEQPSTSLGTLLNNYIQDDGNPRSSIAHSAGAYELAPPTTPTSLFQLGGTYILKLGE